MYKVFINNKRLILANNKEIIDYGDAAVVCLKKPETVNAAFRNHLLKSDNLDFIVLSPDESGLIKTFESNYEVRIAAGGWVWNEKDELLMIYRNGYWDIPKGHLEKGEEINECAIREVKEETGISQLSIKNEIGVSRHIYEHKNKMILKITYWFYMTTNSIENMIPQTEEGIEEVKWIPANSVDNYMGKSWSSLQEFYYDYAKR